MSRKKGGGGKPSNKSPERKSEEIPSESEPEGSMGNQGEDKVQQLLESIVAGQLQMTASQQQTTQLLTQLIQIQGGYNGNQTEGSQQSSRAYRENNNTHIPIQSDSPTGSSKIPRPSLPQFLKEQQTKVPEQQDQDSDPLKGYEEYLATPEGFQEAFSFQDYYNAKYRNKPREWNKAVQYQQNYDLMRRVGRLTIPSFDGSTKSSASAWVQKMDTYLQLNPMTEAEEIKISTLHLDGEAHEWWHHGLVTLGHANITSYVEFTQRVMDRFERKDPEIHFRELAQLR
jgi:hypothetical protein